MHANRRLFLVTWLAGLALVHHAWTEYGQEPPLVADRAALLTLSALIAILPWAVGPGTLKLLRRMRSGGVNLPYAEYWFEGERRAASLDRLAPYLDGMAILLTVFLAAVLALFVAERIDPRVALVSAVTFLALAIAFLGGTVLWVRRVMAAFPAPDASTRGVRRFRRRR